MPDFRRGIAAMQEGPNMGKKNFQAFCPEIRWQNDREEKYLIFLNRAEDIPRVELHQFIPVGTGTTKSGKPYTRYEQFISRTDPAIGESTDELTDRLGQKANARNIAVAVELEPTYKMVNGRKRPTGFTVKTETFTRRTEDGGSEEVEAPVIGVVVQSPYNFFGWLASFNESTSPIEDVPLQVIRRGKDAKTGYDFVPYLDQKVDYSPLLEGVGDVSYLRGEEIPDLEGDDDKEQAIAIGAVMLNKRLSELADSERYARLVEPITEIEDRFGGSTPEPAKVSHGSPTTNSAKFAELRRMHETVS